LLIGELRAEGKGSESGTASIYFGGPRADARADVVLLGESANALFGRWCDATADVDGDGVTDVIVGAPGQDAGTDSAGAVYVYRGGRAMDDVPDLVLHGTSKRVGFGTTPTIVGDQRGDGLPDLAIASPIDARRAKGGGSVRLFDAARFHLVRPAPYATWDPGRPAIVEWLGSTKADVSWSADGGRRWTTARPRAGGAALNSLTLPLPAAFRTADSLRVRVAASDQRLSGRGAEAVVRMRPTR
jgi:hypothetical protein